MTQLNCVRAMEYLALRQRAPSVKVPSGASMTLPLSAHHLHDSNDECATRIRVLLEVDPADLWNYPVFIALSVESGSPSASRSCRCLRKRLLSRSSAPFSRTTLYS